MLDVGSDNFVRGRKESTKRNLSVRRAAESKLSDGVYTWREFLGAVSYTTDSLSQRLQKEFRDNGDQLIDDHEIYLETNGNDQINCTRCHLNIQQRMVISSCGHSNICGECINQICQSSAPNCPNCLRKIESVIELN